MKTDLFEHSIFELFSSFWGTLCATLMFKKKLRYAKNIPIILGADRICFGKNFAIGRDFRCEVFKNGKLKIGDDVTLNDRVHIGVVQSVKIGNDVLIGSNVLIIDHSHGSYTQNESSDPKIPPRQRPLYSSPVLIGERVWIGENVSILPGVEIGDGAIIGAGSVVTKNIPKNVVAFGNPAIPAKIYNKYLRSWERE